MRPLGDETLADQFDELAVETVPFEDAVVLVAGRKGMHDAISPRIIAALSRHLGGDPARAPALPSMRAHVDELETAARLIAATAIGVEVVRLNSGLVLPFPCAPPESGSGTSRALPGVLMLPTGVPAAIYAECWLHECVHTELMLAEWMTGGDLATSPTPLPTPWRTVARPANLLLHGCMVFATVVRFMRAAAAHYEQAPGDWLLSAARGDRVRARDVAAASALRLAQVREAMRTLRDHAEFTEVGRRVAAAVSASLDDLDG
jgi:HEXXH motif-containing protein